MSTVRRSDLQGMQFPSSSEHRLWNGSPGSCSFETKVPMAVMGPLSAEGVVNIHVCPSLLAGGVYLLCCVEASETVDHPGRGHFGKSLYLQP